MKTDEIVTYSWNQDITLKTADQFRDELKSFILTEADRLILSIKGVEYINSSGLGVIADSVMQARKSGKELVIADIHETICEILNIVKFGSFISLFETKEEASKFLKNINKD